MTVRSDIGPFAIVPRWVREECRGHSWPLVLYAVLADRADRSNGNGWTCSRRSLADDMGTSVSTFARALVVLVEIGAIEVDHQIIPGTKEFGWSRYYVITSYPQGAAWSEGVSSQTNRGLLADDTEDQEPPSRTARSKKSDNVHARGAKICEEDGCSQETTGRRWRCDECQDKRTAEPFV